MLFCLLWMVFWQFGNFGDFLLFVSLLFGCLILICLLVVGFECCVFLV